MKNIEKGVRDGFSRDNDWVQTYTVQGNRGQERESISGCSKMGREAHTPQGRYLSKVKEWAWRRSWHPVPSLHGKEMGKQWEQKQNLFSWAPKSMQMVTAVMELKDTCSLEEKIWQTLCIKKQRCYFADKGLSSQSYGFFSSHVWVWALDHKEGWVPKI